MKRRTFLRLAGVAAVPFIIPTRVFGQNAPSRRLNVGCIGSGNQWGGHCDFVLGNDQLQLTSICDVDSSRVQKNVEKIQSRYAKNSNMSSFKGVKTTDDFRELLADKDIDIVWICTPDHWHALAAIAAAEAGKHIYVEKPLARTIAEGRAMVNSIQRAGVVCQVGCQQRSGGEFQRAITLARNGALGKIKTVKVGLPGGGGNRGLKVLEAQQIPSELNYEMWLGPTPEVPYMKERVHYEWRWNYNYGGGQVADWINHHYDIAQLCFGVSEQAPVAIRNAQAEFGDSPVYNTATQYSFEVHYANGEVIEVSSKGCYKGRGGVYIEGESGWIWVDRGRIEHSSPALQNIALPSDGYTLLGQPSDHRQNFIDAIQNGTIGRAPVRQAYYTAMVAHLANAAFRSGISELKWDPATERVLNSNDATRYMAPNYRGPWSLPNA